MDTDITKLQPQPIWRIFSDICKIPRASMKEEAVRDYVLDFAEKLKLQTVVDKTGNVIIQKPATKGMENRKGVILQAHLDMVHQKNTDVEFDFDTDAIVPFIEDGWVKADGTTLGADNGIGVAAALAVLENKEIEHGPLEVLLTIDEETGMTGALGLEPNILKGEVLLNLDNEDEGEICIGCAGGMDTIVEMAYRVKPLLEDVVYYYVSVTGLKGGHSGTDIAWGRGNAIKVINRALLYATHTFGLRIATLLGGNARNAIAREAFAHVAVPKEVCSSFENYIKEFERTVKGEFGKLEPHLHVKASETEHKPKNMMGRAFQEKLLRIIYACPHGVISMDPDIHDMVETSTNLAEVKTNNGKVIIGTLQRSSINSKRDDVANTLQALFELVRADDVLQKGKYPGWRPNTKSEILKVASDVYENKFGIVPKVLAVHAGLECGIIGDVYPYLDAISFGPTIRDPHSPDEKIEVESVDKFWVYLVELLKFIPKS